MSYVVRLGNRRQLGAYLVTLDDEDGNEGISYQQSNACRFVDADFAGLAAVALGDARVVRLRPKRRGSPPIGTPEESGNAG